MDLCRAVRRSAAPGQERGARVAGLLSSVSPHPAPVPDPVALLSAADADAGRLADALHDGALQALVAARYAADAAVRGGDPAAAREAVQEALVALRRAVWLLRPRGEDDLPGALTELSAQRVAAGGVPLDLELDRDVAAALPGAARAAAYRFVQAVPSGSAVRLTRSGDDAVLSVDGPLLDPAAWSARAAALGGRLADADAARSSCLLLPLPDTDPEGER
jgi:hypothetical protein